MGRDRGSERLEAMYSGMSRGRVDVTSSTLEGTRCHIDHPRMSASTTRTAARDNQDPRDMPLGPAGQMIMASPPRNCDWLRAGLGTDIQPTWGRSQASAEPVLAPGTGAR